MLQFMFGFIKPLLHQYRVMQFSFYAFLLPCNTFFFGPLGLHFLLFTSCRVFEEYAAVCGWLDVLEEVELKFEMERL